MFSSFHLSIPANANKISKIHILILQLQTSQEIKKLYVPPVWSTLKFFVSFVRILKFLLHKSSSVGIKHPYIKECYLTCLQKSTSTYVQPHSTKKMKFSIKDFFSKFLRIWTHCLKKFLIKLHFLCSNLTSFPVAIDGLKDSPVNGCNCGSTLTSSHTSIRSDNVIFLTRLCRNDTKPFFLQKACWRSKFSPHSQ